MKSSCDVLVIGSGAGGLSAAVTAAHHGLRVTVAEKESVVGGTTAWSGGWLWIPRNPLACEAGIREKPNEPFRYLISELGNRARTPQLRAFLENGPAMVAFFREHTEVQWIDGNRIPDFHDTAGSCEGGRSVCAAPYDARALGEWAGKLRPPLDVASVWGLGIAAGEDMARFVNWRRPTNALHVARRLGRHALDLARYGRGTQLANGNALAARLLRSALDLGVEVLTDSPAETLLRTGDRVTGARLPGGDVMASLGVVLATGGFPHDPDRIRDLFDFPDHHSAAPPSNTGDGLRLGETAGGRVARDLVHPAAWAPVSKVPLSDGTVANFPHLVDRARPGIIAVGPDGRRFVNEADSYHDFMSALFHAYPNTPHAWIIADARARRRFGIGAAKPFPFPDRPHLATGYLIRAHSLADLARRLGISDAALSETVAGFNLTASRGEDPEFGRGRSPYNRIQGDAGHLPNPSLGMLRTPPFYAVKVVPGSLGTFAGLRTDASARVLGASDRPIPGLFAVGNDAASVMGGRYPSGGITLGPAMTFGYIVGRVLAGEPVAGLDIGEGTAA